VEWEGAISFASGRGILKKGILISTSEGGSRQQLALGYRSGEEKHRGMPKRKQNIYVYFSRRREEFFLAGEATTLIPDRKKTSKGR